MRRGDICWIDFGDPVGSEPGYRRPVLVVSSDRFNRSRISTVLVVPITSNTRLANAPGNVELEPDSSGLTKPSVALVAQVIVIDRSRLIEPVGTLDALTLRRVDGGLRLALDL